jgi:hypothetical protein
MRRVRSLARHIAPLDAIGERDAVSTDDAMRRKRPSYIREAIKIAFFDSSMADEKYGGTGDIVLLEGEPFAAAAPY